MERRGFGLLIALIASLIAIGGWVTVAQAEAAVGFVVSDLQLISTASKPDWTDRWTAPVEAATIMAWFHGHDYPDLLADLNGDGVINELDTIELADRFGRTSMETGTARGTTDPLLVVGLAKYVAGKYPGVFELKIYDAGFPAEFERDIGVPFSSDAVPGITLTLKPEPSYAAYQSELRDGQGVMVGIEQQVDRNYYLAGRSFLFDKVEDGNYGVDLVWAEDDPWQPGAQGRVLQTEAKDTDALYLNYQGTWTKVECMLALSPMQAPSQMTALALTPPLPTQTPSLVIPPAAPGLPIPPTPPSAQTTSLIPSTPPGPPTQPGQPGQPGQPAQPKQSGQPTPQPCSPPHKIVVVNHKIGSISIVDIGTGKVAKTIPVGNGPYAIVISGNKIYVVNFLDGTMSVIDMATGKVTRTVTVGKGPSAVAVNGDKIYVVNFLDGTVSVIDTATGKVTRTIPVGRGPLAIAIDGNKAYVANTTDNTVSVIDITTSKVTATIPVGRGPSAIAITGSKAYVANTKDNTVSVIDTTTGKVAGTIAVGRGPFAIATSGNKAYVTNTGDDTVSVIDATTGEVTKTIGVGSAPHGIAIWGCTAYVANFNGDTVSVIDTATDTVTTTLPAGSSPHAIVVVP